MRCYPSPLGAGKRLNCDRVKYILYAATNEMFARGSEDGKCVILGRVENKFRRAGHVDDVISTAAIAIAITIDR